MMLTSLAPIASKEKRNDFIARLSSKRTKDAIAGEMEVAILWAISEIANLEIDPVFSESAGRPDASSSNLFEDYRAVIEITTLSDDYLGSEDAMRRVSTQIAQFANSLVRKAENHLYFTFEEETLTERGKYSRRVLADSAFKLSDEHKQEVSSWLRGDGPPVLPAIRLVGANLDVTIEWRDYAHPMFNFFTTMPPVTYSLEDNTVFKALKKKERQLPRPRNGVIRCIFVADGGCTLIRDIGSKSMGQREIRGDQIIEHFLGKSDVDLVCTFSPTRTTSMLDKIGKLSWTVKHFGKSPIGGIDRLAEVLPKPRYEGYQARSLHLQSVFDPQDRGHYLGSNITFRGEDTVTKISARALHELLAGRISIEEFERHTMLKDIFERQLTVGKTIKEIALEESGVDEDDDFVRIVFGADPAAQGFRDEEN